MRECGFCQATLIQVDGWEKSAIERAGNPRQDDIFECSGCSRRFYHVYIESFSGDTETWSIQNGETWARLDQADWPT